MIKQILELLAISDWHGVSENIDIAKGKYAGCKDWKDVMDRVKRA